MHLFLVYITPQESQRKHVLPPNVVFFWSLQQGSVNPTVVDYRGVRLQLFSHRKCTVYSKDATLSHLDIPFHSDWLWAHCGGVFPPLLDDQWCVKCLQEPIVVFWHDGPKRGTSDCGFKACQHESSWEILPLISPLTDLDVPGKSRTVLPLLWRRVDFHLPLWGYLGWGVPRVPYKAVSFGGGTGLIWSVLLLSRLAELPLCPYSLNKAIYRAAH